MSKRGGQWVVFSSDVLSHIELYTVPQYGDWPDDQAESFTQDDIAVQLRRYVNRIGRGSRGTKEAIRDAYKIAHYACLLHARIERDAKGGKP